MPASQTETSFASDRRSPAGGLRLRFLEPLLKLAPCAPGLGGASLALAAVAGGLAAYGAATVALVTATAAATLGLLAGAAMLARARVRRHRDLFCASLMQSSALDPDPVMVTDGKGRLCAANPAAGAHGEPAALLLGWCVEAECVADSLLVEARRRGVATREFWRQDRGLRVSLHGADSASGLIVWHFSALLRGGGRGIETLGLPVLSRDGDSLHANAAARALFGDEGDAAIRALADRAQRDSAAGPVTVTLPGGLPALALSVTARDGLSDVVLLPSRDIGAEPGRAPAAFEEIPVALMQIEGNGRIAGTNRYARTLLGLAEDERRFFWEVVEGLGRPVADWLEDARAGRALGRPEVLRATLTGQETFVQIILRRAASARADGALVAVLSDATEFKSLEARFVQSQKMQAIGQLAGGIAHDFNNLLTAIAGHCDLLLLNRDRFDPDYNDLLQIHQNANRAAALVRQLLAFSRKQTLRHENVSLEGLLEDLTHLLTRLVGERINVTLTHDPAVGEIRADKRQLEQVIMNLVVNARDAMPMGGTIRVETEACHLAAEHERGRARLPPGDYALIRVVDQGIGIPADIIDKIFEPFFTTKKIGEGTGLGLSTAYGIVKQMGGYIFADSVEGAGSTFTLYFAAEPVEPGAERHHPVDDEHRPAVPAAPSPRPPAPARMRPAQPMPPLSTSGSILLVEDEAPVRAFAARALRLQGYQVFEAHDGAQALEFLEDPAIRIDLFVTDVVMPGIDGPGWVAQALETRPATPVVFVSGYTEDTLSAAMAQIPGAVFLGKPFSLKDLIETIAGQIERPGVAAAP